ncbi:MAG: hypothetical protein KAT00_15145, partial [Planctomycetes bacterium]|nr:hypothetical protein [Planctomycetota bacterium]
RLRWFLAAVGGPVLLLGVVKICSVLMDRVIWWTDFLTAAAAIVCAVAVSYFVTRMLWREE